MIQSRTDGDVIDRVSAFAQRAWAWIHARMAPAARFGSPASMAFAAALGGIVCLGALLSWPATETAAARTAAAAADVAMTPVSAPAPVVALPPPPVQIAMDYDVVFFWPKTPQTVEEAVSIHEGPSEDAEVIGSARPGKRLRINGRVDDAPDGPWMRVRMENGRDGYFAARTIDVRSYRRPPPPSTEVGGEPPLEDSPDDTTTGAPLFVAGSASESDAPPSF